MTTSISPRALTLAASIGWRHVTADPVRALLLAWRVLPVPLRGLLKLAGPYGRAAMLWGAGDQTAALASLSASPRRAAAFALAADRPAAAAEALERLPDTDPARPVLAARLAWREGRLTDAVRALENAPGRKARRLRATLAAQQALLAEPAPRRGPAPKREHIPGRVLHLVSDALPSVSAGYTIRTHEIVLAQRAAGLDPHVATRAGFPVTQGSLDGRRSVTLDGVPYHRLLPWLLPGHGDADPKLAALGEKLAAALTQKLKPSVLHAASNFANARLALALGRRYGLPVVYEVRGFWEDTWLSRHPDGARLADSELYRRSRALETECMLAADLVVTLGETMREEIESRGVPASKILIVPNAVSDDFLAPLPSAANHGAANHG
ncbi:MAG: glycosyltransferase, partial [Streptosporangiaceae bacterium]